MLSRTMINGLSFTPTDFYEQANLIRGPQTNFTVSPRPSNRLFAILIKYIETEAVNHWQLFKENGDWGATGQHFENTDSP
jgi:hypothetical protein